MTESRQPERMVDFFDERAEGYDEHMRGNVDSFEAFYGSVARAVPETEEPIEILDLGVGTGLELPAVFERASHSRITGIDVSSEMLSRLRGRLADRLDQIRLLQASFLEEEFGEGAYDVVLSAMALHHWSPKVKLLLYRWIREALRPGGRFINGDYIRADGEQEPLPTFPGASTGESTELLHVDLPLPIDVEEQLLTEAGFSSTRVVFRTARSAVFVAERRAG
jgi:tRNA (cmo5U34)-methyltransferase